MGHLSDLKKHTYKIIDEMESDTEHSRSQSFLEDFWTTREKLREARNTTYEEEKSSLSELLNLLNRKAEENDLETYY